MLIKTEVKDSYAILTLNRPDKRNAISTKVIQELKDSMSKILLKNEVRAVIITGEAPAFCAGSDLKELAVLDDFEKQNHERITAEIIQYIRKYPIPTLSAIEGFALGGGYALAIACDYVISANNAKWDMPEVKNGWIPPWGLNALLERVGKNRALKIILGESIISNSELNNWGLIDQLCEPGLAIETAEKTASLLTQLPAEAVRSTKAFIQMPALSDSEADEYCLKAFYHNCATEQSRSIFNKFKPTNS